MTQPTFSFLHDAPAAALDDATGFEIGWDYAHHRIEPPVDHLHEGQRAADFAVRLRREGVISELSALEFEWLCEAMQLHSDGHTIAEVATQVCWDADRLDLGRVGIEPMPSRLCTVPARDPDMRLATNARGAFAPTSLD